MRRHGSWAAVLLGVTGGLAASPALAQQDAIPLSKWTAPAYWQPEADRSPGKGSGGRFAVETTVAPGPSTPPLPFVVMSPCRLVDTRSSNVEWGSPAMVAGLDSDPVTSDRLFTGVNAAHCSVPSGARALSVVVTALNFSANGRFTLYPSSETTRPTVATLNYRSPSSVIVNVGTVLPLGPDGKFRAFSLQAANMIIDVNGYYGVSGTAATSMNPNQVALLRWYAGNQSGGTIAVGTNPRALAFDGMNVWVANRGSDTVSKLRASDGAAQPGSPFAAGTQPSAVAFEGINVWVANFGSNTVSKLRASDGAAQPGSPFTVGTGPIALAFDGTNIWVASYSSGTVSKLRASDGTPQPGSPFTVGTNPQGLAFDGTNIWITFPGSDTVSKLRASDGAAQPGSPFTVGTQPSAVAFDGINVWVANFGSNAVSKLRASDGTAQPGSPFTVGSGPIALAFDGTNIWVANSGSATVTKLLASDGVTQPGSPFAVGSLPSALEFDGANVWVANYGSNTVQKM